MTSFFSFPQSIEESESSSSIYTKVFSAASQMLQTFRADDTSEPVARDSPTKHSKNSSDSPSLARSINSLTGQSRKKSTSKSSQDKPVSTYFQLGNSQHNSESESPNESSDSSDIKGLQNYFQAGSRNENDSSSESGSQSAIRLVEHINGYHPKSPSGAHFQTAREPAQPFGSAIYDRGIRSRSSSQNRRTPSHASSHASYKKHSPSPSSVDSSGSTSLVPSATSLASPKTDSTLASSIFVAHPVRPQLLRSSTSSSATVGVSDAQAVPLLPTSDPVPAAFSYADSDSLLRSRIRSGSVNTIAAALLESNNSLDAVDVESMFSVNSSSASRAYLASQYYRSRSRATPGRLSRELWMKDENATTCFSCNRAFTTFRRKHHCRVCGQIFCSTCTSLIDGQVCGSQGRRVRCCHACEDALISHSSSEEDGDVSLSNQTVDESTRKWPDLLSNEYEEEGKVQALPMFAEEPNLNDDQDAGVDNFYNLPNESYSKLASPVVSEDAYFARSFLGAGHYHSRPRSRSYSTVSRDDDNSSTYISSQGTHHGTNSSISPNVNSLNISGPPNVVPGSHQLHNEDFPLSTARFPNSATVELNNATLRYLSLFLVQLLKDSELDPEEWKTAITASILDLASGLHLEINERVSPREWIKIKRIPGGSPHDVDCINGCVITHSLARKSMKKKINVPRLLLLTFPIEYARNERYMSLEPVVAQEKEYLRKLIARIVALRPSLLLTSSHVCGQAMLILEAAGIAVAQNLRESALFRVCRITRADILSSIDRLSAHPKLGSCESFEQKSYQYQDTVKTFFFFTVKPTDPGRCAIVRGNSEISGIIKVVLEVMSEICYSLKAETALMRDQFVMVANLNEPIKEIMSSSPFVDYGMPFLQKQSRYLEDLVVDLGDKLNAETDKDEQYILARKLHFVQQKWSDVSKVWSGIENAYPFMFNPSSHQNILVLFSLVCAETATPCVGPDPQLIEFYLNTDQTLGKFVETNIEQLHDHCPDECGRSLKSHYKTYVNGNGMITMKTSEVPCKIPGLENSILMWSYCKICEQQMPVVPMSSTTWKYSMGKYLELYFYGEPMKMRASSCPHNVYRDHIRCFGWHGHALKIEYSTVELYEINPPPKKLLWNPVFEIEAKTKAFNDWNSKFKKFWASLLDILENVKVEGLEDAMIELSQERLVELKEKAENDRDNCILSLEELNRDSDPYDYLALNRMLEEYQQIVNQWHSDLADFDGQFFPTERDIRRVTAQHIRGILGDDTDKPKFSRFNSNQSLPASVKSSSELKEDISDSGGVSNSSNSSFERTVKRRNAADPPPLPQIDTVETSDSTSSSGFPSDRAGDKADIQGEGSTHLDQNLQATKDSESTPLSKGNLTFNRLSSPVKVKSKSGNDINLSIPELSQATLSEGKNRVTTLAEHFEELSKEFERERIREKTRLRERQRAIRQRHAHPVAEVFEDVSEAIEDWPQPSVSKPGNGIDPANSTSIAPKSLHRTMSHSSVQSNQTENGIDTDVPLLKAGNRKIEEDNDTKSIPELANDSQLLESAKTNHENEEELKREEPVKLSLIRTLANFWAERSSTRWNGIEYILQPEEHFFVNSLVVIRESEPSSLVAFCLTLPDYVSRVKEFYPLSGDIGQLSDKGKLNSENSTILEQVMLRQTGTHMRYHFERNHIKLSCKIFYSEQFDSLRRTCGVDDEFIRSLSRCSTWESTGGKSGSAFLKTLDDRLILKELSHAEFDSFVNFAPSYFEYMSQALFHDLPTFLSKIFGVYQITIRNTQSSLQVKMYVLVMENLFYGSRFSKVFDLKGSMRNRKVTETGKENEVLLDENMVEFIYDSPVFVRDHSKRLLRASLYNDTLFLTKMNVMDYSLIIGLDEDNKVIFAGIIDYIRTYTWDKKVESWVKTRAATVGVKEPTVVSPKQYKGRFRESMERYFVMVPDCWSQPLSS